MNEEDAKLAADTVIESLVAKGYISEQKYGNMPASLVEDIAAEIIERFDQ